MWIYAGLISHGKLIKYLFPAYGKLHCVHHDALYICDWARGVTDASYSLIGRSFAQS